MEFFQKLIRIRGFFRSNFDEEQLGTVNVPFDSYRKFQMEMREGMRTLRMEFSKVVEENHELKRHVNSVTSRLDDLQRLQLRQGLGIAELNRSVVKNGGKSVLVENDINVQNELSFEVMQAKNKDVDLGLSTKVTREQSLVVQSTSVITPQVVKSSALNDKLSKLKLQDAKRSQGVLGGKPAVHPEFAEQMIQVSDIKKVDPNTSANRIESSKSIVNTLDFLTTKLASPSKDGLKIRPH